MYQVSNQYLQKQNTLTFLLMMTMTTDYPHLHRALLTHIKQYNIINIHVKYNYNWRLNGLQMKNMLLNFKPIKFQQSNLIKKLSMFLNLNK